MRRSPWLTTTRTGSRTCGTLIPCLPRAGRRQRRAAGPIQPGREAGLGLGEVRLDRDDDRHRAISTEHGERIARRARREKGSMFRATIPMTKAEIEETTGRYQEADRSGRNHHDGSTAMFSPTVRRWPASRKCCRRSSPTKRACCGETNRKTQVWVYKPLPGETATLYEMGIPVVETGDRFHVDVRPEGAAQHGPGQRDAGLPADDPRGRAQRHPPSDRQGRQQRRRGCARRVATSGFSPRRSRPP